MAKLKSSLIQMTRKGDTSLSSVEIRDKMSEAHILLTDIGD